MNQNFQRPPGFIYNSNKKRLTPLLSPAGRGTQTESQLYCERIPLSKLAERFGTPLYVYSATSIRERVHAFERAFADVEHTICYSVKANSNLSILRLLGNLGCGFDVVSGGELERVLRADRRAAKRVVFSGVGKTVAEMQAALKAGIRLFNLESASELEALQSCTAKLKCKARIAFRVNPDVPADTHPYISTGLQKHKFGIPLGEARELYARAAKSRYLQVAGVSVHIGSQITDVSPFAAAMERIAELVKQLRRDGHRVEFVDAGGGLGIDYQAVQDFEAWAGEYARAVTGPLRGLGIKLLLEPGRSIAGPAGVLFSCDATSEIVDIVGPVCESGDFFARDRPLPVVNEGELLAILDAGAYGMVLSSNYNTRPRAAEVLVDGRSAKLIRKRETVSDIIRLEV